MFSRHSLIASAATAAFTISWIALTSCSNPAKDLSILLQVEAKKPDPVLMMGDNVYGSYRPFRVAEAVTVVKETATTRIGDGYAPVNFGLIEINLAARVLTLNWIGEGGRLAASTRLDLKDLRRG